MAALFHQHTRFGAWTPWHQRATLRAQPPSAGVYLLGYFEGIVRYSQMRDRHELFASRHAGPHRGRSPMRPDLVLA